MNIVELWREKLASGLIRFDPNPEVISEPDSNGWGAVYYSPARERYKSEVRSKASTSFDMDLMATMHLADQGGLKIAANPNSLFEGHLVIYPAVQRRELSREDVLDITNLARETPDFSFIHNAENSAASILDWVHFQAYAKRFALADAAVSTLAGSEGISASVVAPEFPAYALLIEGDINKVVDLVHRISELLAGNTSPHDARIPLNFIWHGDRVWVIPRARQQTERAARYFGGLEIGGTFCVPNYADVLSYRPEALRSQVEDATFRTSAEADARTWFEERVKDLISTL